jgi:hypothetical protein
MRPTLLRVSAHPLGWSVCSVGRRRRRPVEAWAIFRENDGRERVVGMIARGQSLVRGDRLAGFEGYAPGQGCEPTLRPPALPPADLNDAMFKALEPATGDWTAIESRIRKEFTAAANVEFATAALAVFEPNPGRWFRLWLQGRREHEPTENDLLLRLRALSLVAPGRSLEAALNDTGVTLGALLAAPDPPSTPHEARRRPGRGGQRP